MKTSLEMNIELGGDALHALKSSKKKNHRILSYSTVQKSSKFEAPVFTVVLRSSELFEISICHFFCLS